MPKLHAEEDKKRKEEVEIKNEADALVFRAEKALSEYKDKLPADIVSDVQSKVDNVKKALEGSDLNRIKSAKNELDSHMQHIGEAMAKAQQASGAQGEPQPQSHQQTQEQPHHEQPSSKPGDEPIEEAEVEIIDDNKP